MKMNQLKTSLGILIGIFFLLYLRYFSQKILVEVKNSFKYKSKERRPQFGENYAVDYEHFVNHWCTLSRYTRDWQSLVGPCTNLMSWESRNGLASLDETDPDNSIVSTDIKPAGKFSKIYIVSKTKEGCLKTIGGDTWRVKINGTASLTSSIFDFGNGTYEVSFLCHDEGVYFVYIYLDYTLCNGLRDPPEDWFKKGNTQGKYQGVDVIGKPEDFLMKPLRGSPIRIEIREWKTNFSEEEPICKYKCATLWIGHGRWRDATWMPYFRVESLDSKRQQTRNSPTGNLLVYGDSVNVFFAQSLQYRYMCRKIFKSCSFVYNWVYQVQNASLAKTQRDDDDFNVTRVIDDFKKIVYVPKYNNKHSVVIVNFGLHFVESTNFSNYKTLVNKFAELVTEVDLNEEEKFMGQIIWKTTTAISKERADFPQLHWRRFFTNHRIQLYNAYARDVMCQYGIPVIDAYSISESYPFGTGTHAGRSPTKNDIVHYNNEAFYPIEEFLEEYFA